MGPRGRRSRSGGTDRAGRSLARRSPRGDGRGRKRDPVDQPPRGGAAVRTFAEATDLAERGTGPDLFRGRARKPARSSAQPRSLGRLKRKFSSTKRIRWSILFSIAQSRAPLIPPLQARRMVRHGLSTRLQPGTGPDRPENLPVGRQGIGCLSLLVTVCACSIARTGRIGDFSAPGSRLRAPLLQLAAPRLIPKPVRQSLIWSMLWRRRGSFPPLEHFAQWVALVPLWAYLGRIRQHFVPQTRENAAILQHMQHLSACALNSKAIDQVPLGGLNFLKGE